MRQPLEDLLQELCTCARVSVGLPLHHLSDLEAEEAQRVSDIWSQVPVGPRRQLMACLVELAESDLEMDFGTIFRLGLRDEDAEVRRAAVEGLWEDEDVRLVPSLVSRLAEDEAPFVRAAAAVSLGRFILLGELRKIRPKPYALAYNSLLSVCRATGEDEEVQRRALESLAYASNETVATLISEAYAASEEKRRISAVFAMGRSADDRWADDVRQELASLNPELRYESARACGELGLSEAVPELEGLADDSDPEVQEAALWALGQIGGKRAQQILERYCRAESEATRAAAREALAELRFFHGEMPAMFVRRADDRG
jgi:HEAT repeat protein